VTRDWHDWHQHYDDPASSLSRRLETVRASLRTLLFVARGPVRLVSICAGDGRDTLPVVEETGADVSGVLVELDPVLAERARTAAPAGIEVRTADAGTTASYADACPVDVFLACGVLGNVTDADMVRTVAALPSLLVAGGHLIWTRSDEEAEDVRAELARAGFAEVSYVRPDDADFRVGVHRWPGPTGVPDPDRRLFDFV
jgi:hypothetical protein